MKKKEKPPKAIIKISIKGKEDIIIERMAKHYDEEIKGNEEIAMIINNSF